MGLVAAGIFGHMQKDNPLPRQYYNNLSFDDFTKGQYGQLKPGYISSPVPLHSGYGGALYGKKSKTGPGPYSSFYNGGSRGDETTPGLYIYNDPKVAQQQQQQAYQQQLQATAAAAAAANTKQLQIIQGEKSAVSKMTQEYTAMLQKEADAKAKAQEAARVSAATSTANQARQGQTSNLQIQPASGTSKTAGTQAFKRRQLQFKPQTYGAIASTKSGTLNI